jgi:uncharacterized membrane protein
MSPYNFIRLVIVRFHTSFTWKIPSSDHLGNADFHYISGYIMMSDNENSNIGLFIKINMDFKSIKYLYYKKWNYNSCLNCFSRVHLYILF